VGHPHCKARLSFVGVQGDERILVGGVGVAVFRVLRGGLLIVSLAAAVAHIGAVPVAHAYPMAALVRTESGKIRCGIEADDVTCQRQNGDTFPTGPMIHGYRANQAVIVPSGRFEWDTGQLPAIEENDSKFDTVLTYGQTFNFYGWTIAPGSDGTRFTNDRTGHGMSVNIDGVSPF
jgi:hypothetical protein